MGEQDVADQRRAFSFSLCASRRPRRGPTAAAGAPSSSRADRVCGHEPRRGLGRAPPEAACGEAGRACLNGRYHGGVAWRRNRAPLAEGTAVRVLPPGRLSRSGAAALDDYCRRSDAPVSLSAAPSFTLGGVVPHGPVSRQGITCFTPGHHLFHARASPSHPSIGGTVCRAAEACARAAGPAASASTAATSGRRPAGEPHAGSLEGDHCQSPARAPLPAMPHAAPSSEPKESRRVGARAKRSAASRRTRRPCWTSSLVGVPCTEERPPPAMAGGAAPRPPVDDPPPAAREGRAAPHRAQPHTHRGRRRGHTRAGLEDARRVGGHDAGMGPMGHGGRRRTRRPWCGARPGPSPGDV